MLISMLGSVSVLGADCPQAFDTGPASQPKAAVKLYVQGRLTMKPPSWIMGRGEYISPVERLINRCSRQLMAATFSDSLPERLNVFAYEPEEARSGAFVSVSSVDQKMSIEKTGPYWQNGWFSHLRRELPTEMKTWG